jgi:hypothetical protein
MTERDLELLSAYLDSALTSDERAALEARLEADADLRRELDVLRETKMLIASLPQLRSPRDLTLTSAQVEGSQPRRSILISPWVSLASAAAAFLLFVSGFFSLLSSRLPQAALVASAPTEVAVMTVAVAPSAQELRAITEISPTAAPSQAEIAMQAAASAAVTGTPAPFPTMLPPATVDDAARGDGFAPMTFTPAPLDAANAIMESAPAGGFATEMQSPMATSAADTAMGAGSPAAETSDALAAVVAPTQTLRPTATAIPAEAAALATPEELLDEARPAEQPFRDPVGISLVVAGMLFLFVAVATTIFRMRR